MYPNAEVVNVSLDILEYLMSIDESLGSRLVGKLYPTRLWQKLVVSN